MDRVVIIGDVHGCLQELQALLRACQYNPDCDRLVFVGDLLDRGPNPIGCLRLAHGLGAEAVLGNHEEKFIRYHRHETRRAEKPKYFNPMKSFDDEKKAQYRQMSSADFDFLASWPWYRELGRYGDHDYVVVHAGFEPAVPLEMQRAEHAIRIRWINQNGRFMPLKTGSLDRPEGAVGRWTDKWAGPFNVIYGHAARSLERPVITGSGKGRAYGIDTGCVFGGRLTAMLLPGLQFVQVPARKVYVRSRLDDAA